MQYDLTEEQQMLRDTVRRLAKDEVAPGAAQRDAKGVFDRKMVDLLRDAGLFGADFDRIDGGTEFGLLAQTLIIEELSKVDAACGLLIAVQSLAALPIRFAGNAEQKKRWLPKLATGKYLGAFALTGPEAGSDVARICSCRAIKDGNSYMLNGTKMFITNGGVADILVVHAITNERPSLFVVEKNTPGFSAGRQEDKMGIRWSDTRELIFKDCRVPATNLLGQEGEGFHIVMKVLNFSRLGIAAQALGIAAGALEYATNYANERETFKKLIIKHQLVGGDLLANMEVETEAARQLLYKTSALYENQPKDMSKLNNYLIGMSAKAKLLCSEAAVWVAIQAMQVLGGPGYTKEHPVERMVRDAVITRIYEGTSQIMQVIIAKTLEKEKEEER